MKRHTQRKERGPRRPLKRWHDDHDRTLLEPSFDVDHAYVMLEPAQRYYQAHPEALAGIAGNEGGDAA